MLPELEFVSKRHVPIWRQKGREKRQVYIDIVMAVASLAGVVMLWSKWSDEAYLRTAISDQLAEGDVFAVSIFVFLGLVLLMMAVKLWQHGRRPSAALMFLEVVALVSLALTDPTSSDHLAVFVVLALVSSVWLVVLAIDLEDAWLLSAAAAGLVSLFFIPVSIGLGERALITSCLAGMSLMFFRHFQ